LTSSTRSGPTSSASRPDANPGIDNIAYVTTKAPLKFEVHCAELCGVWHGYMYNSGAVVPKAQFVSWVKQQERSWLQPPSPCRRYAKQYFPAPTRRKRMSTVAVAGPARAPAWRRLMGFNVVTGIILGIGGWFLGYFIGTRINAPSLAYYSAEAGENDIAIMLGYLFGVMGFLIGLGFANYPISGCWGGRRHWPSTRARARNRPLLRLCTDHKVVRSSTCAASACSSSSAV